jgi:hypothetical protein
MKYLNLAGAFIATIFTSLAFAVDTGGYRNISWINVENGHVYIKMEPALDLSFCGDEELSKTIIKIDKDSLGFDQMYSLALAAYISKQGVRFFIKDCGSSPWNKDIAKVYSAQIGM